MFLLVPAHPGFPGQIPQSRKTVVCVCVLCIKIASVSAREIEMSSIPSVGRSVSLRVGLFVGLSVGLSGKFTVAKWLIGSGCCLGW